jgi:hypothetical protein
MTITYEEVQDIKRGYGLQDLPAERFRYLLRLAHNEGLLFGLLKAAGIPVDLLDRRSGALVIGPERADRPILPLSPSWPRQQGEALRTPPKQ